MEKSNDLLGEILKYGPSQGTFFLVLKKMKEEGRSSEVVRECQKALSLYPDDLRLRTLLAESYLGLGFIGLAETELATVTSRLGDLASAYKLQAEIYTKQQRTEEAVWALNQYLVHRPDDHDALDLLDKTKSGVEGEKPKETQALEDFAHTETEDERIEEQTIIGTPEIIEDVVRAPEEGIESEHVPESPELSEDVVHPQEEDILESVVIPEDITRALEDDIEEEEVVVAELPEERFDHEEKDEFAELATTELAEIYYNQGLINEAINTYELALLTNPDDKTSMERLAELKALNVDNPEKPEQQTAADDILRERKKRMITVLEEWMDRVQKLSHA
jgi:tetratricopeptide (TPR) repeat protein